MTADVAFILLSLLIQLKNGPRDNFSTLFPWIVHRAICSVTATAAMGTSFSGPSNGWAFTKFSLRPAVHGKLRRECLDHVMVFYETGLRRILKDYYFQYYEGCRTHLSLEKDAPIGRPIQRPALGQVIEIPQTDCIIFTHGTPPKRTASSGIPRWPCVRSLRKVHFLPQRPLATTRELIEDITRGVLYLLYSLAVN